MTHPQSIQISRIVIQGLFGRYDYDLRVFDSGDQQGSRIAILYGDNGTGKTTILNLLFHLLSPASRRGHKSFIARTPFRSLAVHFSHGTQITVFRSDSGVTGTFDVAISRKGVEKLRATYRADEENIIPGSYSVVNQQQWDRSGPEKISAEESQR